MLDPTKNPYNCESGVKCLKAKLLRNHFYHPGGARGQLRRGVCGTAYRLLRRNQFEADRLQHVPDRDRVPDVGDLAALDAVDYYRVN
jgi:hypothetical protein